jgi:hypothetical protein
MRLNFRQSLARSLRKWADLIDPRTKPSEPMRFEIQCDSSAAEQTIERLKGKIEELQRSIDALPGGLRDSKRDLRLLNYLIQVAQRTEGAEVWRALLTQIRSNKLAWDAGKPESEPCA